MQMLLKYDMTYDVILTTAKHIYLLKGITKGKLGPANPLVHF